MWIEPATREVCIHPLSLHAAPLSTRQVNITTVSHQTVQRDRLLPLNCLIGFLLQTKKKGWWLYDRIREERSFHLLHREHTGMGMKGIPTSSECGAPSERRCRATDQRTPLLHYRYAALGDASSHRQCQASPPPPNIWETETSKQGNQEPQALDLDFFCMLKGLHQLKLLLLWWYDVFCPVQLLKKKTKKKKVSLSF